MSDGWHIGAIPFAAPSSQGLFKAEAAGWVNGLFGLDFRMYHDEVYDLDSGFQLTHIPTGYAVCAILAPLPKAKKLAEEIQAGANWDFSDAGSVKPEHRFALASVEEENRAIVKRRIDVRNPFFGMLEN